MNTIIEVMGWGDFDVQNTRAILVSEEKLNVDDLIKDFCIVEGIPSIKGVDYRRLYDTTSNLIAYLELRGFKLLKTTPITISD